MVRTVTGPVMSLYDSAISKRNWYTPLFRWTDVTEFSKAMKAEDKVLIPKTRNNETGLLGSWI